MPEGASARRALALFDGLLRRGGNRKIARTRTLVALQFGKTPDPVDLAGETALIIRRLIVPIAAAMRHHGRRWRLRRAFPAPLPGQAAPANVRRFRP